ncbi:MAG: SURF1 family protein [Thiobacillaceae bacterium]|jgi:surfeit locus 1 family protein
MMGFQIGAYQFRPGLWPSLATVFFFVLTLFLGNWQMHRAEYKRGLQARYDQGQNAEPIHLGGDLQDKESLLFRKVEVQGEFDETGQILIDNRVVNGVAGYHVLAPLHILGSSLFVLVNRGWVPATLDRSRLPVIPKVSGNVRIVGIAVDPVSRYFEFAGAEPRNGVWQNLNFQRYQKVFAKPLQPILIQQTSDTRDGLYREWPRPDAGVATHVSYAIQWFGLAATLLILYAVLNFKKSVQN